MDLSNVYSQEYIGSNDGQSRDGEFVPEQTPQPQYPPPSALSNPSDVFSTISNSLPDYEPSIWPTPSIDLIGLENNDLNIYSEAFLGLDSQCLSYDGSYGPSGYDTRTTITYSNLQPLDGQSLDLDSTFDFSPDYTDIGLDQMHNWYKGIDYNNPMYFSNLDSETSSMWNNDTTIQDLSYLGNQFDSPFSTQINSLSSSQIDNDYDSLFSYNSEDPLHTSSRSLVDIPRPQSLASVRCDHDNCVRTFARRRDLEKHRKTHLKDSQKPHLCPSCERGFLYPKDLARHKSSIHDKKDKEGASSSSSRKTTTEFMCPEEGCPGRYTRQADLNRHIAAQHADMTTGYRCMSGKCARPGKIWHRIDHLVSHMRRVHTDENIQELIQKSRAAGISDISGQGSRRGDYPTFSAKEWKPGS